MDDFLHNLRSGKLKQPDRGRRDYSDYKGPQRRTSNERRRTDYYAKVTGENFALVKDSLQNLAEQQKRIADALGARTDAESRIADALESIAAMLERHVGTADALAVKQTSAGSEPGGKASRTADSAPTSDSSEDWHITGKKLTDGDRPKLMQNIASMRDAGQSWEKIARQMIEQAVPTVSGKGIWRGPAVKKFWDAHAGKF